MQPWLKLIGSSDNPVRSWDKEYIGFRKSNKPGIRLGDHVFLYAPGGSRRIFALAEAVANPEPDPDYSPIVEGSCQWRVKVRYLVNLPVDSGILIEEANTGSRNLAHSVRQQSHIRLRPDEHMMAKSKLEAKNMSFQ